MKIDLTCPVELWQYAMPVQDASECTFVLNNLSSKVVTSVMLTLSCFNKDNKLLFRQSERMQGLRAGVGERFSVMLLPTHWREVESIDLTIDKVWFDDATIWRRGNVPLTIYTPNNLPNGRALDELRFVAGADAVGYPERQEQVWICVCGRANPQEAMRCCRCARNRESVFAGFSRENVAQVVAVHERKLADVARQAREDNSRIIAEQETHKQRQKKKKRTILKWCLSGAAAALIVAVIVLVGIPALRYQHAQKLLTDGQYVEARAAFAEMGAYRDVQEQIMLCDYERAKTLLEGGEDSLLEAEAVFLALKDYSDSPEQAKRAVYRLGETYLEQKLFDKAMDRFQSLGDYENSADMCNRCVYEQAEELRLNGNETVALALYTSISHYEDASQKMQACYYALAQQQADEGNDEEAARLFTFAGEYEDAGDRHDAAIYRIAQAALAQGDLETAGMRFLSVASYGDAQAKANDCLYQHGRERMQAGDYEAAALAFERIAGYLDSEGQAGMCRYQQAKALMEAGDYAAAAPLLQMTDGYDDADELLRQCNYRLAQAAMEQSDMETAERLLDALGGYQDSARLLQTLRYQLAEDALARQGYADAMKRYEALDGYKDSRDKLTLCRYELAKAAAQSGDYQAAMESFAALGNYGDSPTLLEDAAYELAQSYEGKDDVEGMLELLPRLEGMEKAANKLRELLLNEGAQLEGQGDDQKAAELYAKLGDVALDRYHGCLYRMAQARRDAGEIREAGDAFLALGDFEDAAEQARDCYYQLFGAQAAIARDAMEREDYRMAISALLDVERTNLPAGYTDLETIYEQACYGYAEALYRDGQPYRAMPFYHACLTYRDAAAKLERRAYLILGSWQSSSGMEAVFRTDGTCVLGDESLSFRVSNFSLYTGAGPEDMKLTHQIISLTKTGMSLRDMRGDKTTDYRFTKTGEAEMPPMDMSASDATPGVDSAADGGGAVGADDAPQTVGPTDMPEAEVPPADTDAALKQNLDGVTEDGDAAGA